MKKILSPILGALLLLSACGGTSGALNATHERVVLWNGPSFDARKLTVLSWEYQEPYAALLMRTEAGPLKVETFDFSRPSKLNEPVFSSAGFAEISHLKLLPDGTPVYAAKAVSSGLWSVYKGGESVMGPYFAVRSAVTPEEGDVFVAAQVSAPRDGVPDSWGVYGEDGKGLASSYRSIGDLDFVKSGTGKSSIFFTALFEKERDSNITSWYAFEWFTDDAISDENPSLRGPFSYISGVSHDSGEPSFLVRSEGDENLWQAIMGKRAVRLSGQFKEIAGEPVRDGNSLVYLASHTAGGVFGEQTQAWDLRRGDEILRAFGDRPPLTVVREFVRSGDTAYVEPYVNGERVNDGKVISKEYRDIKDLVEDERGHIWFSAKQTGGTWMVVSADQEFGVYVWISEPRRDHNGNVTYVARAPDGSVEFLRLRTSLDASLRTNETTTSESINKK